MSVPIFNNGFDVSQATATVAGIPVAEGVRDYVESADKSSGPDLSKVYFCNWVDRFTVANACLGLATISGGRGGHIVFNAPLQHPEIPLAYVGSLRITGKGRPFQGPKQLAFPVAMISMGFRSFPWNFSGADDPEGLQNIDPETSFIYATQEIDQGEETQEIPASALTYTGGRPLNRPMSIAFAHAILRISFFKMPQLSVATLPYYNRSNVTKFLGCDKGKVRFRGSTTHRDFQSIGPPSQTVVNTYHYRPVQDWNYFIDPDAATVGTLWKEVTFADTAKTRLFPYDDLTETFPNPAYVGTGA